MVDVSFFCCFLVCECTCVFVAFCGTLIWTLLTHWLIDEDRWLVVRVGGWVVFCCKSSDVRLLHQSNDLIC